MENESLNTATESTATTPTTPKDLHMEYSRGELYLNGVNIRVKRVQSLVGEDRMWKFRSARRIRTIGVVMAWLGWIGIMITFPLLWSRTLFYHLEGLAPEYIWGILILGCPILVIIGYILKAVGSRRMKFLRDDFNAEHLIGL